MSRDLTRRTRTCAEHRRGPNGPRLMATRRVDGVKRDAEIAPDVPAQRPELPSLENVAVEEAQRTEYSFERVGLRTRIKVLGLDEVLIAT